MDGRAQRSRPRVRRGVRRAVPRLVAHAPASGRGGGLRRARGHVRRVQNLGEALRQGAESGQEGSGGGGGGRRRGRGAGDGIRGWRIRRRAVGGRARHVPARRQGPERPQTPRRGEAVHRGGGLRGRGRAEDDLLRLSAVYVGEFHRGAQRRRRRKLEAAEHGGRLLRRHAALRERRRGGRREDRAAADRARGRGRGRAAHLGHLRERRAARRQQGCQEETLGKDAARLDCQRAQRGDVEGDRAHLVRGAGDVRVAERGGDLVIGRGSR
mmetsp:Transcript_3535/g.14950  ORF Transcript_3535/g.14950 Transcript_3535/m.14950 type:complete len:269 (-) Transcript_3535:33-839(-)